VVKLILQASDAPLLPASVLAEVVFLQEAAKAKGGVVSADDLRATLGKAPARPIDTLGHLCTLLSKDATTTSSKLAYSFGPLLFLPRFDHATPISKEYGNFDHLMNVATPCVIAVTKMLIEQVDEVFSLNDEKAIAKHAQRLRGGAVTATIPAEELTLPGKRSSPKMYRAEFAFDAEQSNEINLFQGELVQVLEKGTDGWWRGVNQAGEEGLFPGDYVEVAVLNEHKEGVEDQSAIEIESENEPSMKSRKSDATVDLLRQLEEAKAAKRAAEEMMERVLHDNRTLIDKSNHPPVDGGDFPHFPTRPLPGQQIQGTPRPTRGNDKASVVLSDIVGARLGLEKVSLGQR